MIETIKYTDDCVVNPNSLVIPKWGYNLEYTDEDALPISYDGNLVVVGNFSMAHPPLAGFFSPFTRRFDIRLWTESKVLSLWTNKGYDPFISLLDIYNKIQSNDFKNRWNILKDILNLNVYQIIFCRYSTLSSQIVRCSFSDIENFISSDIELISNEFEKGWHILSPALKQELLKSNKLLQQERYSHYRTMCSKWEHKIGNMDVAEWHLLFLFV